MPGLEGSGRIRRIFKRHAIDVCLVALLLWIWWPTKGAPGWEAGGGLDSEAAMTYLEEHLEGLHPDAHQLHMAVNAVAASRNVEALEWLHARHPCVVFDSERRTIYSVGPSPLSDSVSAKYGHPDPWEIHRRSWRGSGWFGSTSWSEVRTPHGFRVHALELREDRLALDVEDRGEARYQSTRDRWGFELGQRDWIEFDFYDLSNY